MKTQPIPSWLTGSYRVRARVLLFVFYVLLGNPLTSRGVRSGSNSLIFLNILIFFLPSKGGIINLRSTTKVHLMPSLHQGDCVVISMESGLDRRATVSLDLDSEGFYTFFKRMTIAMRWEGNWGMLCLYPWERSFRSFPRMSWTHRVCRMKKPDPCLKNAGEILCGSDFDASAILSENKEAVCAVELELSIAASVSSELLWHTVSKTRHWKLWQRRRIYRKYTQRLPGLLHGGLSFRVYL